MPKIEKIYILNIMTVYVCSACNPNVSGSINFVEQRLKLSRFEGSMVP